MEISLRSHAPLGFAVRTRGSRAQTPLVGLRLVQVKAGYIIGKEGEGNTPAAAITARGVRGCHLNCSDAALSEQNSA